MVIVLIFAIGHKLTWQYIRLFDKIVILMTFGSVFSTIIARQVNSLWIGNLIWFVLLGWMCWQKWSLWENYHPEVDSITTSNGFQPIKSYEQVFPQQKQIANELVDIIHNQNPSEPLSICIAGKWGSGKTSIVNGVVDRLKQKNTCQYEILYIKTMELDTLSSLFTYVFDRIRDILKRRGAYVGIGSEYRKFLTSAIGKITEDSFATLLESRLIPSSDDYREQLDKLEEYISNVLKQDKILVIVDDVERCEIKKAQEFIFFIKEIATVRNCVTIFLTDNVYLNQQQYLGVGTAIENPADNNYFYYEKFFNFRVDVPPIIFEEAMSQLEKPLKNEIQALRFRTPSELFIVFLDKFQKTAQKYKDKANKKSENKNSKKILLDSAETLNQLCMSFFNNFSTPRTLVKYCNLMKIEYSRLIDAYMQNEVWKEGILDFLLEICFDEILFLLTYIEICAPYEARCLKEQELAYLRCPDTANKTRRLIREMREDLLYSYFDDYTAVEKEYLYNKASIFTQAYIDRKLPQIVDNFSSKDESWLNAIEVGKKL